MLGPKVAHQTSKSKNLKLLHLCRNLINVALAPHFQDHEANVISISYDKFLWYIPKLISKCFHNICIYIRTIFPLKLSCLNVTFYTFKTMDNFISVASRYGTLHTNAKFP
jgi:hypothetical protein